MRLLVQGVGQRFRRDFDRPWGADEERASRLVVIGEKGIDRAAVDRRARRHDAAMHVPRIEVTLARRDGRSGRSRPDAGGCRVPLVLRQRPQRARSAPTTRDAPSRADPALAILRR